MGYNPLALGHRRAISNLIPAEADGVQMKYLYLVLKGVAYGVTNLVPAIGGGTILILLRIYEQFVDAWGNLLNFRRWKEIIPFLFFLGLGAAVGMVALSGLINLLWTTTKRPRCSSSSACSLGTIPSVLKMHRDMRFTVGSRRGPAGGHRLCGRDAHHPGEHHYRRRTAGSIPPAILYTTWWSASWPAAPVSPRGWMAPRSSCWAARTRRSRAPCLPWPTWRSSGPPSSPPPWAPRPASSSFLGLISAAIKRAPSVTYYAFWASFWALSTACGPRWRVAISSGAHRGLCGWPGPGPFLQSAYGACRGRDTDPEVVGAKPASCGRQARSI